MNKPAVSALRSAVFWLLTLLLSACAAPLTPSTAVICPKVEMPALSPDLSKPPQPESYLEAAQSDIEAWQQQLMDSETR